jgi:hypothetical protein
MHVAYCKARFGSLRRRMFVHAPKNRISSTPGPVSPFHYFPRLGCAGRQADYRQHFGRRITIAMRRWEAVPASSLSNCAGLWLFVRAPNASRRHHKRENSCQYAPQLFLSCVRHRKRENSIEPMPETCEHRWIKNGTRGKSKSGTRSKSKSGFVQRWVCTKCGKPRNDYEHDPGATRLQALALVATRRLSFDQAEYLTGPKSENITKHLRSVVADPGRWAETREKLSLLGTGDQELDYLRSIVDIANLTNQRLQGSGPNLNADLAEMKRRIESVIGCEVVFGTSRQGVRVCRKKDFDEFMRKIRRLPIDRLTTTKRLSTEELRVLRQLHTPNAEAKLLSRLQSGGIEIDPVTRRLLPPKLTMRSLADGLKMDVRTFTGIAVALVRKLRRLTAQTKQ